MSKAFTRESDDDGGGEALPAVRPQLPPGAGNYITPGGAQRLRTALAELIEKKRLLTLADDAAVESERRKLESRIRQLQSVLPTLVVTRAPAAGRDQVRFGATVTVKHPDEEQATYRIVGVDETDLDRGWISWVSPLARALLSRRSGERIRFRSPAGEEELKIDSVSYEPD